MAKAKTTLAVMLLGLPLALAACGTGPRYPVEPPAPVLRLNSAAQTIMVNEVSLPDYAAAPQITHGKAGAIVEIRRAQWADDPARGVTQALAHQLDTILSGTVASDPWPLPGLPDAEITVRVTDALAGADNVYRFAGSYYVGSDVVRAGPASAPFDIRVPMASARPAEVARAQSAAVAKLAEQIARGMGR